MKREENKEDINCKISLNITNLSYRKRNLTWNVRYILDKIWYNANGG